MARRRFLHDVEMVEEDDLDAGPGAPSEPTASAPPRGPGRRRAITSGVAVLVVVAVGAVAAQVVTERRREAHVAAVGALPYAVAPLPGPPTPLWDLDEHTSLSDAQVRTGDDLLVGVQRSIRGPVRAIARDARTGEPVWEVELLDASGRPEADGDAQDMLAGSGSCVPIPRKEHHVACLAHDGLTVMADDEVLRLPASDARVVVLDTRDGSVASDLTQALAPTATSSLAAVGDVVAVLDAGLDPSPGTAPGASRVRVSTSDGAAAWEATLPAASRPGPRSWVAPLGDLLAVISTTEVTVFDTDGGRVRTVPVPEGHEAWEPDADTLYVTPHLRAPGTSRDLRTEEVTVVRPAGDIEVTGELLVVNVDDDSVPGLVLTLGMGGMLQAWDGDDTSLWSTKLTPSQGALLVDGRLHLSTSAEVVTLDARTGAELWRSDATGETLLTDGRHLLAMATAEPDAPPELVALDPADGSERWRSPLPPGTVLVGSHLNLLTAYWFRGADQDGMGMTVLG